MNWPVYSFLSFYLCFLFIVCPFFLSLCRSTSVLSDNMPFLIIYLTRSAFERLLYISLVLSVDTQTEGLQFSGVIKDCLDRCRYSRANKDRGWVRKKSKIKSKIRSFRMMHVWKSDNVLLHNAIHFHYTPPNIATTIEKHITHHFIKWRRERCREGVNEEFISTSVRWELT